jgi:hypothetical protein
METHAKHHPKASIEAKLRAIEDACHVSKIDSTQVDPDLMLVHTEEIRDILMSIGVLGRAPDTGFEFSDINNNINDPVK